MSESREIFGDAWLPIEEYERRHKLIREEMKKRDLDCLIVVGMELFGTGGSANCRYIAGYEDQIARFMTYVVFPLEGEPTLIIPPGVMRFDANMNQLEAPGVKDVRGGHVAVMPYVVAETVKDMKLEKSKIGVVGQDFPIARYTIPHFHFDIIKNELPEAQFEEHLEIVDRIRMIKSPAEIKLMEKAGEICDYAMETLVKNLRVGITEYELVAKIYAAANEMKADFGRRFAAFGITPMANPHVSCHTQTVARNRYVRQGDYLGTEMAFYYGGYSCQIARGMAVRDEPPKVLRDMHEVSVIALERIQKALKTGCTEEDLIKAGSVIWESGFYTRVIVHAWGTSIELPPHCCVLDLPLEARPQKDEYQRKRYELAKERLGHYWLDKLGYDTFQPGMIVMIEPYPCSSDLKMGIEMGETVVVTDYGGKSFSKFPRDFFVV